MIAAKYRKGVFLLTAQKGTNILSVSQMGRVTSMLTISKGNVGRIEHIHATPELAKRYAYACFGLIL